MRRALLTTSLVGLLTLGLFPAKAFAQYRFDNWTTDDGMPQNTVSAIAQTRDGYLWLATAGGLVRFDGLRSTVFDRSNTKGLARVRFSALFEDTDGSLWIGTEDCGLTRYRHGTFVTYTTQQGLPHNRVWGIWGDDASGLLVLTSGGLVRWQHEQFLPYASRYSTSITQDCFRVQSGAFWCVDRVGLNRIKDDNVRTYTIRDGLSSLAVSAVYEDREGNVWIGTADGLNRLQHDKFTRYTTRDGVPKDLIQSIYEDRQRTIWLATQGGGLSQFQDGRFITCVKAELQGAKVKTLFYEDREGNLWLGTSDRGLRRLKKDFIAFYSADGELARNKPYPVLEDHSGNIWIGTRVEVSTSTETEISHTAILVYESRLARLRRAHAAQESFSRQMIESQESERKRIAAELHDSLGQSLAIIKSRAALSLSQPEDHQKAMEQLDEISGTAVHAIDEVREIERSRSRRG